MTKISYFGKQNSTLGSVVPLAMFSLCADLSYRHGDGLFGQRLCVSRSWSTEYERIKRYAHLPYDPLGAEGAQISCKNAWAKTGHCHEKESC